MKVTFLIFSLLFTVVFYRSMGQSIVLVKKDKPKAGRENSFLYRPNMDVKMPDRIQIVSIFINNQDIQFKKFPVNKIGNDYFFSLRVPDSTSILILTVTKPKPLNKFDNSVEIANILDNNNGIGYIIPLYSKKGKRFVFEDIDRATLLHRYAPYMLKLRDAPRIDLIRLYESTYQKYPNLKSSNEFGYHSYLDLLYKEKRDTVKPILVQYAKQMERMKHDENKWIWAANTYRILGMEDDRSRVEQDIISSYPTGKKAKQKFWQEFYSSPNLTTADITASMKNYISRFKDTSSSSIDNFYILILSLYLNKNMWDSLPLFERLTTNKLLLAQLYNNFALRMYNGQPDTTISTLNIARILSKKSIDYTQYIIANTPANINSQDDLQDSYNKFSDTYAQILYKLSEVDSAYYYQHAIYLQSDQLDPGGIERYVLYAEKVKGEEYTKPLIEKELLKGVSTPALLAQLKSIYKKLGISEDIYKAINDQSSLALLKRTTSEIKIKFGITKSKDFTLKNILGQAVSLSSLEGKVVVLDFWATWCKPCIAAFPGMQGILNRYKDDKEVTFLFVDVLERTSIEKMQENALKLMKDGNYSFNVLLDPKNELVANYKIQGLPIQFIIDKKGNMVFMGDATDNISSLIEGAKKL